VSEGGIGVAVAEMAIAGRLGVDMSCCEKASDAQWLFSESNGRFIVEVKKEDVPAVLSHFSDEACQLGIVTDNDLLLFSNGRDVLVTELSDMWKTQQ